jgi:glycosyltransferase involved in cell wall biosynthesis
LEVGPLHGKHICFIVGTLGQGGAEKQLHYILGILKRAGVSVSVLCLTKGEFWESRIRELGIPVNWVGSSPSRLIRLRRILQQVRQLQPDVIQSSHFYTNLYAAIAGRIHRVPVIGALRNDGISEVASTGKLLGALSLRLTTLLAANSWNAIENAKRMGVAERKLFFLPNAIDVERFRTERRNGQAAVIVLTAGRLVEQKRMDRFVRLIARLKFERRLPVRGVVVGDGPLLHSLREQAYALSLTEQDIQFRGKLPSLQKVYEEADLFVLTSEWEGTPNVVLEAMAAGLPVVATNVGGVPALIQHGTTGLMVNKDDEEGLLHAVERVLANSHERTQLAKRALDYVRTTHSLDRLRDCLLDLYSRVMNSTSHVN